MIRASHEVSGKMRGCKPNTPSRVGSEYGLSVSSS